MNKTTEGADCVAQASPTIKNNLLEAHDAAQRFINATSRLEDIARRLGYAIPICDPAEITNREREAASASDRLPSMLSATEALAYTLHDTASENDKLLCIINELLGD